MKNLGFKPISSLIAIFFGLVIWFAIPIPKGVTPEAWHLLAIFVGTIAAIIGKAMPIGALSIIAITLVALTGVTSPKPPQAMKDALSGFSNPLIWLIGVSIMISRGLLKTGLGKRIGYMFISIFGKKTLGVGYALAASELVIAPFTPSNTARGGGIIHPIMKSIAESFSSRPEDGTHGRIGRYLALVNYNCNPITSAMFITATAPNPLIVRLIAEGTNNPSIHITWLQWALAAFIPGIVSLLVMPLVIYKLYPPEIKQTPDATKFAKDKLQEMGSIKREEKIIIAVFAILLLFWASIPTMIFDALHLPAVAKMLTFNSTAVAFLGLSILLITNVLTWDDVLSEKGAWDTITWFAALVMMASYLGKLGLITWFSHSIESGIQILGLGWVGSVALLVAVYFYAHYFFASTTAHITAMYAAFFAAGLALGAPPLLFALILGFSSSLMMSLTHYGTGTAPVIFGSNYTTLGQWWITGFVLSVVNLFIWAVIGGVWWKILGYW